MAGQQIKQLPEITTTTTSDRVPVQKASNDQTSYATLENLIPNNSIGPAKRSGGFAVMTTNFTSAGTKTVSGVTGFDFTPKYVRVTLGRSASDNSRMSIGVAWDNGSSIVNYCNAMSSNNSPSAKGWTSTSKCVASLSASTGSVEWSAEVTAFASGSITFSVAGSSFAASGIQLIIEAYA